MKVICRACGSLIEEDSSIKMNMVEYLEFMQDKTGALNVIYSTTGYHEYTQICNNCYSKPNVPWDEDMVWCREWQ